MMTTFKRNSQIKLICFDLGGVIIRICRSWEEACRVAGIRTTVGLHPEEGDTQAIDKLRRQIQTGHIDVSTYAQQFCELLNGACTPEDVLAIHHAWLIEEYEGVGDVIDQIHDAGIVTSSLSNTDHAHWERMPEFPTVFKLQHLLTSHALGMQKPDEEIYREVEKRLGFNSNEILFFDDLQENVYAARACGWQAVLINHAQPTASQIQAALVQCGALDNH